MRNKSIAQSLFLALKGALIGMGAILPGISGGVLCLVMGIYRPMMALLAHPLREIRKQFWFFLPVMLGFAAGVLGLSRLVEWMFSFSPLCATWLFIGLIIGTLPGLWREAGAQGRPTGSLISGGVAFIIAFGGLLALTLMGSARVEPSTFIWLVCGVLWAVGFLVPGLSPSSLFIFMGVYPVMTAGIADLNMSVILPMGLALAVTVLILSRAVNALFRSRFPYAMHVCLGIAIASALVIVPISEVHSFGQACLYTLCGAIGLAAALYMERLNARLPRENS